MDTNKSFYFMVIMALLFTAYWIFWQPQNAAIKPEQTQIQPDIPNLVNNNQVKKTSKFTSLTERGYYDQSLLTYENKNIKLIFSEKGAVVTDAFIKDTFLNRDGSVLHHINYGTDGDGGLLLKLGSWDSDITLDSLTDGNDYFVFKRDDNKFVFTSTFKNIETESIYTVKKIFTFYKDEFVFKCDIEISNSKSEVMAFDNSNSSFSIGWGPTLGIVNEKNDKKLKNFLSYFDGKKIVDVKFNDKKSFPDKYLFNDKIPQNIDGWVVNNGHYFATAILSDNQRYRYFFDYRQKDNNKYYTGYTRELSKSVANASFNIYLGPKVGSVLGDYNKNRKFGDNSIINSKINKLERSILFGIGNVIGWGLSYIYSIVKNYGLAIIIITFLIKLLLAPLTHSSMVSQKKMMDVQPKLKELQLKFKDDPQKLNEETMKFYKKSGINPLGGCLPLLLQMPLLIAMYELLVNMVELKSSSFLWIKDLSAPDKILEIPFAMFGMNGIPLHILPILMVITQFLTSALTPSSGTNNSQTKMMMFMLPIVFFFIFYNVSSGLVLYWTVMNILNLFQQVFVNRNEILKKLKKS